MMCGNVLFWGCCCLFVFCFFALMTLMWTHDKDFYRIFTWEDEKFYTSTTKASFVVSVLKSFGDDFPAVWDQPSSMSGGQCVILPLRLHTSHITQHSDLWSYFCATYDMPVHSFWKKHNRSLIGPAQPLIMELSWCSHVCAYQPAACCQATVWTGEELERMHLWSRPSC